MRPAASCLAIRVLGEGWGGSVNVKNVERLSRGLHELWVK